jgi:hypothetical protein
VRNENGAKVGAVEVTVDGTESADGSIQLVDDAQSHKVIVKTGTRKA